MEPTTVVLIVAGAALLIGLIYWLTRPQTTTPIAPGAPGAVGSPPAGTGQALGAGLGAVLGGLLGQVIENETRSDEAADAADAT